MESDTFAQFRRLIYRESGIALGSEKEALLTNRIFKRIRALKLDSPEEYLRIVETDMTGVELISLLDVISTNVTYFYREDAHFAILGKFLDDWNYSLTPEVRIWCAASSTGEEPYTLAITAKEHIRSSKGKCKILATDISTQALQKATRGVYTTQQLEKVPSQYRKKYFYPVEDGTDDFFQVSEELRDMLTFSRMNLSHFPFPLKKPLDFIFCRNVMIYFDRGLRQKIIDEFQRLLKPGGYLFLSHSENLLGVQHNFVSVESAVYQKPSHSMSRGGSMSDKTHVGIAQTKVSRDPTEILFSSNLGSCVGVAIFDPKTRMAGLIHCLLPLSQSDPEKAKQNPAMYVDTGVVQLLNEFIKSGSNKRDLQICVAGGSQINDASGVFEIGKKNYTILRKVLWKNNLLIKAEHVGGSVSRTISLHVGTGEVWLRMNGENTRLA